MGTYRKAMILGLILVTAIALAIGPAAASPNTQETAPANTITVSGVGQAFGAPDIAYLEVGVDMVQPNVVDAFSQANMTINTVIESLKAVGIEAKDMRTSGVNIWAEDRYNQETGVSNERVYHVNQTLRIVVRDVNRVEEVINTVVSAGATNLYGFTFGIANTTELERQARTEAIANARARAQHLAEIAGVKLGDIVMIEEQTGPSGPMGAYDMPYGGGGGVPVEQGQLSVNVQVQIAFSIVR